SVAAGDTVELLVGGSSLAHPVTHAITSGDVSAGFVNLTVIAGDLGTDGDKSVSAQFSDPSSNASTTSALTIHLDTTADADANLPVAFNDGDGFVNHAEQSAASYTVSGVDSDASATVTFSDGTHNVVVSGLGNGTTTVDLSGLDDGPITASISA